MKPFFVLMLMGVLTACGRDSRRVEYGEGPPEPQVYSYRLVGGQELQAHVFTASPEPGRSARSAVLLFHGGGWHVGSPEWTFGAAERFSSWGMVAIAIEYRLSDEEITPIDALADVCAAFVWTRDHASELGIDPARVAGYGLSAGGHLVASTATVGCPDEFSRTGKSAPDALLLWSPALDTTLDGWFVQLLRGKADAQAYSPAHHVRAYTPPTSIVLGREDTLTPLEGASRFCEGLVGLGGVCELHVFEGLGHLLTRNLENQESDFDPDPAAEADGIGRHRQFLQKLGFTQAG
jgi:acetyl esterase/lipase